MRRNIIAVFSVSLILMLVIPFIIVRLIRSDAAMALCFILFYAVNPLYCIIGGWLAGKDIRDNLWFPVVVSVSFLIGTWSLFEFAEPAFIMYAVIYLGLSCATMFISHFVEKMKK